MCQQMEFTLLLPGAGAQGTLPYLGLEIPAEN